MFETKRHKTSPVCGLQVAAFVALLLFGLQGVSVAGHHHDAGTDSECAACHFGHVQGMAPELPVDSPLAPEFGQLVAETARSADSTALTLPPSRGPPA